MVDEEALERAKKRVDAKIGFYIHLTVYVGVNVLLLIINLATLPPADQRKGFFQDFWFYWPLLGWGIGVMFHALGAFLSNSGASIKERMIEKELAKEEAAAEEIGQNEKEDKKEE
ncbi:MAG: 2TM domain-containing protein [Planctomycetes bacterium]|nr:2TM domain-containing protein [Planctomycetota bacterium]